MENNEFKWDEQKKAPEPMIAYNIIIRELVIKPFIKRIKLFEEDEDGRSTNIPLRSKSGRIRYGSFAAFKFDCLLECRIKNGPARVNDILSIWQRSLFMVIQENQGAVVLRNIDQYSISPFFMNSYGAQLAALFARAFSA